MDDLTKANELLASIRLKLGKSSEPVLPVKKLPEITPLAKALAKKDEVIKDYIWGFVRISTGEYLAGRECEGGVYFVEDYRRADYFRLEKGQPALVLIPDYCMEQFSLEEDDFEFVEAEIIFKK